MKKIKATVAAALGWFKRTVKNEPIPMSLMLASAIGIAVTTTVVKENALTTLPLYVSLLIGVLTAGANRYANLLGSINCIFYTLVYIYFGLYGQALQALLISCPIQMVTFVMWHRRAYKSSTHFRSLKLWQVLSILALMAVSYVGMSFFLDAAGASYPYLDNAITVISTVQIILALLSFREFSWVALPVCVLLVILDVVMIANEPIRIAYLIYSAHALLCAVRQFFSVRRIYREQREGDAEAAESTVCPEDADGVA